MALPAGAVIWPGFDAAYPMLAQDVPLQTWYEQAGYAPIMVQEPLAAIPWNPYVASPYEPPLQDAYALAYAEPPFAAYAQQPVPVLRAQHGVAEQQYGGRKRARDGPACVPVLDAATALRQKQTSTMTWFRVNLHAVLANLRNLGVPHTQAVVLLDFAVESPSVAFHSEHSLAAIAHAAADWMPARKRAAWLVQLRECIERRKKAIPNYVAFVYVSRFQRSILIGCFMLPLVEINKRNDLELMALVYAPQ
jgi:hypothetical protein